MKHFIFFILLSFLSTILIGQSVATCGFSNKKVITIQGAQITGGPHTDFPILIDHTDGVNLTTAAGKVTSASGFDIIFADDNGDLLDFQLEDYNGATGQIIAWVKIPSLTNGTSVNIHMLYGKASLITDQSSTNTWNSSFEAVYNLNDDFNDQTSNGNNGTNVGSTDVVAQIADGQDFESSSSQYIQISDLASIESINQVTISCWITPESFSTYDGIVTKYSSIGTYYGINCTSAAEGGLDGLTCGVGNTSFGFTAAGILSAGVTAHVAMVFDGTQTGNANRLRMYVDGANVPLSFFGTTPAVTASSAALLEIGRANNTNGQAWDGIIDQVAIERTAQSANWIATQYTSQNSPEGTFYTITTEIDNDYNSTANGDWDVIGIWGEDAPPHIGANVTVDQDVDIDVDSDDYIICNCTVSSTGNRAVRLDLSSTRNLHVLENLDIDFTGAGGVADTRIQLTTNAVVDVDGNFSASRSNTNIADIDLDINLRDDSDFNILGDATIIISNGDDLNIDIEDNSTLNITGNLTATSSGGDEVRTRIDDSGQLNVTGDVDVFQTGGDDIFIYLNVESGNDAQYNITGNFNIDHDGGGDVEVIVDDASTLFSIGGNLTIDLDAINDDDITLRLNGGDFMVAGTTSLSRSGNSHEILLDVDGGDFTSSGMTLNNQGTDDLDHSIWVNVEAASVFTINGDLDINQTAGNNVIIDLNEINGTSSMVDINGNLNIDHDGGSNILLRLFGANSTFDISGSLLVDHDGGDDVEIETNGANSTFNIGTTAIVQWDGGTDSEFEIDLNAGNMTVGGFFSASRSNDSGPIFFNLDGGHFNANVGMTLSSSGALFTDGGIIFQVDNSSVFTCTGNMTTTMTGGDDFEIGVNRNVGTVGQFNCTGNLAITRTNGDDIEFFANQDNSLIDIGGNLSITTTGGEQLLFDIDNDATINVDGNMSITATEGQSGLIILRNTGLPSLDIGGDFDLTIAGGNDDYTINLDSGEVTVGQDMNLTESTGNNQLVLDMDGGNLSVTRDFFANLSGVGTATELIVDLDNGAVMTVGRDVELDISGGNDIEFHLEQNNTAGTAQLNITRNFTLDHNGATGGDDLELIINNDATVTVGNDFTMDTDGSGAAGNFVTQLNDNSLLDVNGNIIMNSVGSGLLQMILTNTSKLELAGNFVRQAPPNNFGLLTTSGTSTIEYNGTANVQTFAEDAGAGTDVFNYENVIINNSFGTSPQLTMEGLATVHGDITFADGIIASTSTNLLVLADNSDALSESDASFVDGPVKKIGNDAFDFPVGDSSQLQQISMTAPGLVTDEFTGQYFEVDVRPIFNGTSLDPTIDHISGCEYWTLDRTLGSSNVQVTLNYDANSCGVTDLTSLIVARWDGTTWRDHLGTVTGTLASGGVQTPAPVTNFSPFTLASTNSANPLPIELLSFDAIPNQDQQVVDLFWTTASEINNDFFTIQRSVNGLYWEDLAKIDGAGNSSSILHYYEKDLSPYKGLSYYRLSQTDFDGTITYSKIISVNLLIEGNSGMAVFPNPASKNAPINIVLLGFEDLEIEISIIDAIGKVVVEKKVELIELKENSKSEKRISFGKIPSGTYIVIVSSKNSLLRQKLIVK